MCGRRGEVQQLFGVFGPIRFGELFPGFDRDHDGVGRDGGYDGQVVRRGWGSLLEVDIMVGSVIGENYIWGLGRFMSYSGGE